MTAPTIAWRRTALGDALVVDGRGPLVVLSDGADRRREHDAAVDALRAAAVLVPLAVADDLARAAVQLGVIAEPDALDVVRLAALRVLRRSRDPEAVMEARAALRVVARVRRPAGLPGSGGADAGAGDGFGAPRRGASVPREERVR